MPQRPVGRAVSAGRAVLTSCCSRDAATRAVWPQRTAAGPGATFVSPARTRNSAPSCPSPTPSHHATSGRKPTSSVHLTLGPALPCPSLPYSTWTTTRLSLPPPRTSRAASVEELTRAAASGRAVPTSQQLCSPTLGDPIETRPSSPWRLPTPAAPPFSGGCSRPDEATPEAVSLRAPEGEWPTPAGVAWKIGSHSSR